MNLNQLDMRLDENRIDLRVKDKTRIQWKLEGQDVEGQGKVHNISASGMLLEMNTGVIPNDGCSISFGSEASDYIPQNGRLVWQKKKRFSKGKCLCGVEFVEPQNDNVFTPRATDKDIYFMIS